MLSIKYPAGGRHSFDFGVFARDMTSLLEKNIIDAELRDWIMPAFTTSTILNDEIVASILMMSSMQRYFKYKLRLTCGIPSVALLGEKEDYEKILRKLDKLSDFGEEPRKFGSMLRPVVSRMIRSFEAPTNTTIIEFWQRIFHVNKQMSGATIYCGWINAFCFWDKDGKRLRRHFRTDECLMLDEVEYPQIDSKDIPSGWAKVPVTVDDNGEICRDRGGRSVSRCYMFKQWNGGRIWSDWSAYDACRDRMVDI